jgi:hypothetical protein
LYLFLDRIDRTVCIDHNPYLRIFLRHGEITLSNALVKGLVIVVEAIPTAVLAAPLQTFADGQIEEQDKIW